MTLGGPNCFLKVRCKNAPTVIVKEKKPDADGRKGSMSLCDKCLKQFKKQLGEDYASVTPIKRKA